MALLVLVAAGCQRLGKTSPNVVASITISNQTVSVVAAATEAVFVRHDFQGGRTGATQFTFQRAGSAMENVVYGEWIDRKVVLRAVVTLKEIETNITTVVCDARMVSAPGDTVFEESFNLRGSDRKQVQQIVAEIGTQANSLAKPGTGGKPVP